ncbi:MAG: hypothetical protein C0392_08510 [Syntrophus sp. (in: bacteria)]|nr:hypothetical protein [Syntrophus sp. (in: bacteria)]
MIKNSKKNITGLSVRIICIALLLGTIALAGCAGLPPPEITYSVEQGGFVTSSETVQYDRDGGSKVVSEYGVDPRDASGFQEQIDFQNYGLDPDGT